MADLASQDILRAPCGGVGEGWERIFNDFWDPKKAHVQHFFVKNTHLLRDLFFSDVSRRNRAAPKGGQPLQSAVYSSKNQLFRFWLRTLFLVHVRPVLGPVLGPKVATILFF